jgi:hypothetical protein
VVGVLERKSTSAVVLQELLPPPSSFNFQVLRVPLRDVDNEDIAFHFKRVRGYGKRGGSSICASFGASLLSGTTTRYSSFGNTISFTPQ